MEELNDHKETSIINHTHFTQGELALLVADSISAMIAYWDKDLVCRFANEAYREWFGKTKEEMINKMKLNELLGPLYQLNLPYITGALQGKMQTFEREIPAPSGGIRHSLANYYPHIVNGEVKGFIVHVADITPVKLMEKELIRLKQLEARNQELEQFTYIASHDLQEPLRSISNIVNHLENDFKGEIKTEVKHYIDSIARKTVRMSRMIKELLDYSRLGRDRKIYTIEIKKIINNAIINLGNEIRNSGAKIYIGEMPVLNVYKTELTQVFQNLISNAIKFSKKDVKPEIWINCRKTGDLWQFSIRDNGIGIKPKYTERIFKLLQRLHSELEYPGFGIGLAFCKKIVELHGGKMWVESEPEVGSTFYFSISNLSM